MIADREDSPDAVAISTPPLQRGRRVFQRYDLERIVGSGGMGVVWLARDVKLERSVALKFLPEVLFRDPAARDDLKRETRRSLDLTHPHIVRIHDFVEDEEMAAIAMEYVDGPTLSQLRVDRPSRFFEPDDLKIWTGALCTALDYAHEAGHCVHRDLKPSNLMVSARGVLKVADFGIACGLHYTAARVTVWSGTGGTLGYMSPQQLFGELAAPTDDIYSVGATLFELLTGKPPFHSGDVALQIREVASESIGERRRQFGLCGSPVPAAWEETIAACLAKNPRDRPRTAREIARRLGLPTTTSTEIAPLLLDDLPPTLGTNAPVPPKPAPLAPYVMASLKRVREGAEKYLWPAVTAAALLASIVPWIIERRPRELVESPRTEVVLDSASPVSPETAAHSVVVVPEEISTVTVASSAVDRVFLTEHPAPPAASVPQPSTEAATLLEITTSPAGIAFQIFPDTDSAAGSAPVQVGESPAKIEHLPPGSYRVVFAAPGLPPQSASVQIAEHGVARVEQEFPRGVLIVTSQPKGAEIFCDDRSLGLAPLEVDVLAGKHAIGARWDGRTARVRTVSLAVGTKETVAFDFRSAPSPRARSRRSKVPEDDSVWDKMGRSLNKLFTGEKNGKSR